jgi:hypothetical protein
MSDIFISYASEDRDRVKVLAEALAMQGWLVWWDREIPFGKAFDQVIKEALNDARCIVVAWSKHSIESDWVIEEAQYGRERKILVPVLLDEPHDELPPFGFRRIQGANLRNWDGTKTHPVFQKLVADITSILGTAPVPPEVEKELKPPALGEQPAWEPVKRVAEEVPVQALEPIRAVSSISSNTKYISVMVFGWAIGEAIGLGIFGTIAEAIGSVIFSGNSDEFGTISPQNTAEAIGGAARGVISGWATGYALKQIKPTIQGKHIAMMAIGWGIGWAIGWPITFNDRGIIGGVIGEATGGVISGWATRYALKQIKPSIQGKHIAMMAISVAIMAAIGDFNALVIGVAIRQDIGELMALIIGGAISGAMFGAIGGAIMLWCLRPPLAQSRNAD